MCRQASLASSPLIVDDAAAAAVVIADDDGGDMWLQEVADEMNNPQTKSQQPAAASTNQMHTHTRRESEGKKDRKCV